MNIRLVAKLLGIVSLMIGAMMVFSLPWAFPALGYRNDIPTTGEFESRGFLALLKSITCCALIGMGLLSLGRNASGKVFRKEAMAVVGLSWIMATALGALPYWLSSTAMGPAVRMVESPKTRGSPAMWQAQQSLLGISGWSEVSQPENGPVARAERMTFVDCLFESQSGFSTTGSTVIADLEDPESVPHCILFWRSSTHFLGGLGILVLFVALLGQGSSGKALMQAELTGPSQQPDMPRMRNAALAFAGIYVGLNLLLTIILVCLGLSLFDAICHAFGTMATGGFSTYNSSLGHFDSVAIEAVIMVFMILAGTNFMVLYFFLIGQPARLLKNIEWRVFIGIIAIAILLITLFAAYHRDFAHGDNQVHLGAAIRHISFQVISVITTSGFGTHDFDSWNPFGKAVIFGLMFIGGCGGSTGGGIKVIRFVLFSKILRRELETVYHPNVVRPIWIDGKPINPDHRHSILVYFSFYIAVFALAWLFLVATEPNSTWMGHSEAKLFDGIGAISATFNNIGPGFGTLGPTQNFGHFTWHSKLLFTWLMMLGRVEIFVVLALFTRKFWKAN